MQLTDAKIRKAKRLTVPGDPVVTKEFSERELAALNAVHATINDAVRGSVFPTFVRNFRAGRITKHGGEIGICRVRLTFGFQRRDCDIHGAADAVVNLEHLPVTSRMLPRHIYHVWVPYDVEVTVRGDVPVLPGGYDLLMKVGDSDWRAASRVYVGSRA